MSTGFSDEKLMEAALSSPAAVGRKDRLAWISLFAKNCIIEDPIGSKPHIGGIMDRRSGYKGNAAVQRFYDTFIAPNQITFHVDNDIVADPIVVRDITIELKMPTGITAFVPMHAIYEITVENNEPRIVHLWAHWELIPMVLQVLSKGFGGILGMTQLFIRMIRNQGLSGVIGFCAGFLGIYDKGKRAAEELIHSLNTNNCTKISELFDIENDGIVFPAETTPCKPEEILKNVKTNLNISKVMSAGYTTTFSFTDQINGNLHNGVGLLEFNQKTKKIHKAIFFRSSQNSGVS